MAVGTLAQWIARVNELFGMSKLRDSDTIKWEETKTGTRGNVDLGQFIDEGFMAEVVATAAAAAGGLQAKIDNYDSGTDTHRVDVYAAGYGEAATETNVDLDSILNLAANEEFPVGTQLMVYTNTESERIGQVNGLF